MPSLQFNLTQTNVPQQIINSGILFRELNFFAYSGFATVSGVPISNAANIYIGTSSGNLPFVIAKNTTSSITYNTIQGRDNLGNYWACGQALDGLFITWQ
jgi:hypothetical protein